MNKKMIGLAIAFLLLIAVGGLLSMQYNDAGTQSGGLASDQHAVRELQVKDKSIETSATIAGIGDILLHDRVYEDAKKDGSYDFAPMFAGVKDILKSPDFLIANQESTPGGTKIGLSTYPSFNSPYEIIDTLQDVGVDVVTTANNHSIDRGEKGLLSAIDYYEKCPCPMSVHLRIRKIRIQSVHSMSMGSNLLSYRIHTEQMASRCLQVKSIS
ncbi:CapA family protein [Rossellomorea sp. H39__3]